MEIDKNKFAKFQRIYIQKIAPYCKDIEKKRKELLETYKIYKITFASIAVVCFILLCTSFSLLLSSAGIPTETLSFNLLIIIGTISFLGLICSGVIFLNKTGYVLYEYKRLVKQKFFPYILKCFGIDNWTYYGAENYRCEKFTEINYSTTIEPSYINLKISYEELQKSSLFRYFNSMYVDDEFQGKYQNTNFSVSETKLFSEGGRDRHLIFSGVVLLFQQPQKLKHPTIVTQKGILSQKNEHWAYAFEIAFSILILVGFVGVLIKSINEGTWNTSNFKLFEIITAAIISMFCSIYLYIDSKKQDKLLNKVTLEYNNFNKRFNIYSHDQTEARYLLTPAFMEKFYDLKNIFKSKKISCSFYEDKLMAVIYTKKDTFEIGNLFTPVTNPKNIAQFYKELNAIYNIIDVLKIKN